MLASTSRQSHCGEAELAWLKMLIRFLWINARAWPVNSDNPGNRVRGQGDEVMFAWWVKESSAGGKGRSSNDGDRVGKKRGCLQGEQRKIKVERERGKTGGLWREKKHTVKLDGRAVKDWAEARNEMCWVSCPFFVWFVCEPMICMGLWVHLHV